MRSQLEYDDAETGDIQKIIEEFGSFDEYLWNFTDHRTYIYRKHQEGEQEARNELSDQVSGDLKKRGI